MPDLEIKDVVKAVDGVNVAFEEFKATNDENLAKRDVILEEKLAKIEASIDANQKIADEAVLAAKRASRVVVDETGAEVDLDAKAADWARTVAKRRGSSAPADFDAKGLLDYRNALNTYMRKGEQHLSPDELKALSVGSDPDGGYTVHPDMSGRIASRKFETSPIRAYASVQVISTDSLEGMYDNDEAGSGWVGETQARAETDTPQLGAWRIPTHELSAAPRITQKLLDDSELNIEQWLMDKVNAKIGRDEASAMVSGNGTAKPRGFLTYANYASPGVFEQGKIEQFATGASGAYAAAPNGADVLINALYGLKAEYVPNADWFMSRNARSATRKLKDSDGAYVWVPGAQAGEPAVIFGTPVAASFDDMPVLGADSLSIAVGDMREAYQIVDRTGVRTLRDPYTAKPFVIFYSTKRVGGDVVNFEALKLVKFGS